MILQDREKSIKRVSLSRPKTTGLQIYYFNVEN